MSSSGEDADNAFVMYSDRPEWSDVKPLTQDDGDDPVVRIAYSKEFTDVYDYFRAIYASGEVSTRALELTADAAQLNPANYTVWHHRRFLLKALQDTEEKPDLREELAYIRSVIEEHSKNYQVWQHRRVIVEWLQDPSAELRFCEIILSQDAKNYHAWQHRQWVVHTFNLFDGELAYVERLLEDDVRNNSAWNQRAFILNRDAKADGFKGDLVKREVDFTLKAIKMVPGNESAWNYLRGLIDRAEGEQNETIRAASEDFCEDLYKTKERSPYLMAAMVDLHVDKMEANGGNAEQLERAKKLCSELATQYDVIRKEYWEFMSRDIQHRFGSDS